MSAGTLRATRRTFLKGTGSAVLAALTIGFEWGGSTRRATARSLSEKTVTEPRFAPNAFLRIGADDSVTVIAKHLEMGQGAYTGIATVVAEELDADWTKVRVESAPADVKLYANSHFGEPTGYGRELCHGQFLDAVARGGRQGSGDAPRRGRQAMARAGAGANAWTTASFMTQPRSAARPSVRSSRRRRRCPCQRQLSSRTRRTSSSSAIVSRASMSPAKSDGNGAIHPRCGHARHAGGIAQAAAAVSVPRSNRSMQQRRPRCPASSRSYRCRAASRSSPRVSGPPSKGEMRLQVEWDDSKAEKRSSADFMDEYRRLADQPALSARKEGDAAAAIARRAHRCRRASSFRTSLMRPWSRSMPSSSSPPSSCEIWAGDQFQTVDQANAAHTAGLDPQQVSIHTLYAGGSFGRRANPGRTTSSRRCRSPRPTAPTARRSSCNGHARTTSTAGLYRPMYFHKLEAGSTRRASSRAGATSSSVSRSWPARRSRP